MGPLPAIIIMTCEQQNTIYFSLSHFEEVIFYVWLRLSLKHIQIVREREKCSERTDIVNNWMKMKGFVCRVLIKNGPQRSSWLRNHFGRSTKCVHVVSACLTFSKSINGSWQYPRPSSHLSLALSPEWTHICIIFASLFNQYRTRNASATERNTLAEWGSSGSPTESSERS